MIYISFIIIYKISNDLRNKRITEQKNKSFLSLGDGHNFPSQPKLTGCF